MKPFISLTLKLTLASGIFAGSVGLGGCVASRDPRNGVFDENQYIKKAFLVPNPDDKNDPGWIMQGTIEQVSSPNALASLGLYPGRYSSQIFKFNITSDKLQTISQRAVWAHPEVARADAVINAWPVTNVDL